ncbi:MAG: helix-turn-helix transcriptional regulator [Solidesulfovibrio sp.]
MGPVVHHPILVRLERALLAIGASHAARRLELLTPALQSQDNKQLESMALRHCREYGLDSVWILTGHGEAGGVHPFSSGGVSELTPVFAMTSVYPQSGRWRLKEIERIPLAPELLSPTRFVTRMDGRCLEPRIRHGAYLVVDTARGQVPEGSDASTPFAVDVQGEGLVVRLARYERSANRLELTGVEPNVPPFVVPCGAPDSRVVGQVVWVAQSL